jgi:SAM-dependent methyltransferase
MRVVDLDRDMSHVIPTGASSDSVYLFRRMEEETFAAIAPAPGQRAIDVAAGAGQDDRALAARGARVFGVEPSRRMTALARLADERAGAAGVSRLGAWSERLPFASAVFEASFCKGSLDHFDDPRAAIREMARVTKAGGRVVLAVANFESLGCRLARALERVTPPAARGRRLHDVPSDHFTRYDAALLRREFAQVAHVERWVGVSLLWGWRPWALLLARLGPLAPLLLRAADAAARLVPGLADVIVVSGYPRTPRSPA